MDEEIETKEEHVEAMSLTTKEKENYKEKYATAKSPMKETKISNKRYRAKTSKVESNPGEKKTLMRKLVASSDSEYDAEVDVLDIVPLSRKKVGERKIPINVHVAPLDNMSFHTKGNV